MNKQKGFTLVEVIGVVTVLALILVVAVPSLTKTLKRNEQNKYNDYIDNLKIAAENYVVEKLKEGQFFEDGKDYNYISLGDLIDAGYIKNTIINPENDKILSRDSRVKIYKEADNTFSYDVQEYYNNASDYNKNNLIIHYDAVEYSQNNIFKNLTGEIDYNYSNSATWTEDGVYFDKNKTSNAIRKLNNNYNTGEITVSFNIESLDALGNTSDDYTYPLTLFDESLNYRKLDLGLREYVYLFYYSGNNTVIAMGTTMEKNKTYTLTYVQEDLTTRKLYLNGELLQTKSELSLETIDYSGILISPRKYNLNLNNMLIYNRALSAQEVQELYALDKERFGE